MRYMNIGLAVSAAIIFGGVLFLRDSSEAVLQAVALVGMVAGVATGFGLEGRAKRRGDKHPQ